ncbi:MAG: hypothetical protein SVE93_06105 [Candidatus Thermoplasmatota archaeon]|nr:hypothetical protein [Candidatus Thermoplasmatota archaeon]
MSTGTKGLRIEVPTEVLSGETFKVIVTYNEYPASKAQLTFEGAVIEPTKTDSNGVALVKAPNITRQTKVKIHIKYRSMLFLESYSFTDIMILPKKEEKEKEKKQKGELQRLFKGQIKIAAENYWSANYEMEPGSALLISIKTDGKTINEYVLNKKSYTEYTTNEAIRAEHYHYNVVEGEYTFQAPHEFKEEWYVVLENPHKEVVSVSISISKIFVA